MDLALIYLVSFIAIVLSVFITLLVKNELEQLFREHQAVISFHICNVVITLMVSLTANAVMTIYGFGKDYNWFLQLAILLFMTLPIYYLGHLAFVKYNSIYRKYETSENQKVLVLNEKYIKKKKHFKKLKTYNAAAKQNKAMDKRNSRFPIS
ncbi:hypothetical protein [Bacillus marasmi]|uniref:hypothetical protein n=1 Tax=Bacillus marasmi TaxID=1926279 RepID=UPI0011C89DF1|nr:hypothetical protein [Bacillus marasmi]